LTPETANELKIRTQTISYEPISSTYNIYTAIKNNPMFNKIEKEKILALVQEVFTNSDQVYFFIDLEFEKEWNDFRKANNLKQE